MYTFYTSVGQYVISANPWCIINYAIFKISHFSNLVSHPFSKVS